MRLSVSIALVVSLAALAAGGCVDYVYRHHVTGKVVDGGDRPIAEATVRRVLESGEQYGLESLYARTTDAEGRFDFEHSGLGPKPEPSQTWILVVEHPRFDRERVEVEAGWIDPKPSGRLEEHGYVALDLKIRLAPKPPVIAPN